MSLPRSRLPLLTLIGCVALIFVPISRAETPRPVPLTLQTALARASELNPRLAALGYTQSASDALIEQAGQRPAPTLELSTDDLLGSGDYSGVDRAETTLRFSQILERGGKRDKRITLATHERDAASAELGAQRTEVLTATALAYTAALAAQQRVDLAQVRLKHARALLASLHSSVQSGTASAIETAHARVAVIASETDCARAAATAATARAKLAAYWGDSGADLILPAASLQLPSALPDRSALLARLSANPHISSQQARIASQRAALVVAKSQTATDVTASGGVRYYHEGSAGALVLGVSMPLPTPHYNQGNIRAARAAVTGAEQTLLAVKTELHAEFSAAWHELQTAHATVHTLRHDALPATDDALAITQRAHAQGEVALSKVFDAQRAQLDLTTEILDAEWAYANALVRLDALTDPTYPLTTRLLSFP